MADYAGSTHHSQQPLRRFAHLRRFDVALALLRPEAGQSVLDLGAGDGYFLRRVAEVAPRSRLTAVEPDPKMAQRLRDVLHTQIESERVQILADGEELQPSQFDRLVCLDVMEHLPRRLQRRALQLLHRSARPGARLVVSVPVEVGPVGLIKVLARFFNHEPIDSWRHVLLGLFGKAVPRPDADYIATHTGFRYSDLEIEIHDSPWALEHRQFSPWAIGGWLLNSQVLYVLKAGGKDTPGAVRATPTIQLELDQPSCSL